MNKIWSIGISVLCAGIIITVSFLGVLAYGVWDENRAAKSVALTSQMLYEQTEKNKTENNNKDEDITPEDAAAPTELPEETYNPMIEINGEFYAGILYIPSLSLKLPVNNQWSDDRLKETPCRYAGDIKNSLIICAHDYKSHFGNITRLSYGERLFITDAEGNEHWYSVGLLETLKATDIDILINAPYDLTLFTCTPSGKERIAVRCEREQPPVVPDEKTEETEETEELEETTETESISIEEIQETENITEEIETGVITDYDPAPDYKPDYKKEIIKLKKGDFYSLDGGLSFAEVKKNGGVSLDISGCITNGSDIRIKKPGSEVQIIMPVARAMLESATLSCNNGKITLDTKKYEVYNPKAKAWGSVPKVTADTEFNIRLKETVKETKTGLTGNAASISGTLKITYGVYDTAKNKSGIIAAEIVIS